MRLIHNHETCGQLILWRSVTDLENINHKGNEATLF